jgi:5'-methylthioadenosine phosphorylase
MVPECVLAREAELCYASTAMITDYDCWKDHPVSTEEIVSTMRANVEKVKKIIVQAVAALPKQRENCHCSCAVANALV